MLGPEVAPVRPLPYLCPACNANRSRFELIYHLVQQVTKDPRTGQLTYAADQLEPLVRQGRPWLDVRCLVCHFTGHEGLFVKAARRSAPPVPPPPSAGGC